VASVIFVTAFDAYAVRAFDVHALDYLLKPIGDERFAAALGRARVQVRTRSTSEMKAPIRELLATATPAGGRQTYASRFTVRTGHRIAIVQTDDIDWIEATGDYATLHVGPRCHLLRETLARLEARPDPERFIRVSQVNGWRDHVVRLPFRRSICGSGRIGKAPARALS
jgi:two-component system LytT family response regulator